MATDGASARAVRSFVENSLFFLFVSGMEWNAPGFFFFFFFGALCFTEVSYPNVRRAASLIDARLAVSVGGASEGLYSSVHPCSPPLACKYFFLAVSAPARRPSSLPVTHLPKRRFLYEHARGGVIYLCVFCVLASTDRR